MEPQARAMDVKLITSTTTTLDPSRLNVFVAADATSLDDFLALCRLHHTEMACCFAAHASQLDDTVFGELETAGVPLIDLDDADGQPAAAFVQAVLADVESVPAAATPHVPETPHGLADYADPPAALTKSDYEKWLRHLRDD